MRSLSLLVLALLSLAHASCSSTHRPPDSSAFVPAHRRGAYVEERAAELIKRGLPRDEAVARASSDWLNVQRTSANAADEARRREQAKVNSGLAKMVRDNDDNR